MSETSTSPSVQKRVFLGGTCGKSTWRDKLIPLLEEKNIEYFNPVVPDWTPECQAKEDEVKAQENTIGLFVITSDMVGVFSIAEVVDLSNKKPQSTILYIDYEGFTDAQGKSLHAVERLVNRNGAAVCFNLPDVVHAIQLR